MANTIQFKRGLSTATAWNTLALLAGEPAFLTDTDKFYVGDGTTKVLINPLTETEATNIKTTVGGLGTAASKNTGIASGNVPILDVNGKLADSVLPKLAISNVFTVASESAMLALDAQEGDIAIRTDQSKTYILSAMPANLIGNWKELLSPTDQVTSVNTLKGDVVITGMNSKVGTGYAKANGPYPIIETETISSALGKLEYKVDNFSAGVTSINGKTGVVTLAAKDLLMTGYVKPSAVSAIVVTDTTTEAIGKLEFGVEQKANIASPTFTGTPKSVTPTAGDNSTNIATTAFVTTALTNGNYVKTVNTVAPVAGALTLGGADIKVTGYTKATSVASIAATDSVNTALGKLEKGLEIIDGGTF